MRDDCNTLDATSERLDSSQAQLGENNTRLREQIQSMRSSSCWICIMLMVVALLFVLTLLLMKLKSKRVLPVPVPVPSPPASSTPMPSAEDY